MEDGRDDPDVPGTDDSHPETTEPVVNEPPQKRSDAEPSEEVHHVGAPNPPVAVSVTDAPGDDLRQETRVRDSMLAEETTDLLCAGPVDYHERDGNPQPREQLAGISRHIRCVGWRSQPPSRRRCHPRYGHDGSYKVG